MEGKTRTAVRHDIAGRLKLFLLSRPVGERSVVVGWGAGEGDFGVEDGVEDCLGRVS